MVARCSAQWLKGYVLHSDWAVACCCVSCCCRNSFSASNFLNAVELILFPVASSGTSSTASICNIESNELWRFTFFFNFPFLLWKKRKKELQTNLQLWEASLCPPPVDSEPSRKCLLAASRIAGKQYQLKDLGIQLSWANTLVRPTRALLGKWDGPYQKYVGQENPNLTMMASRPWSTMEGP